MQSINSFFDQNVMLVWNSRQNHKQNPYLNHAEYLVCDAVMSILIGLTVASH